MDPSNPQMMQMAQMIMQDPEVMQMMQQPGMMEKLQAAMSNPSLAMSDPDVMRIVMKLQGMGMGGGGGGGGMGGGGFGGGASPAAAAPSGAAGQILHASSPPQLSSILSGAGSKLVVVDYFTTWCGPCKAIAPLFQELASQYAGKVVFVKVDGDQARDLVAEQGVRGFPTFQFYVNSAKIEEFSGADQRRLREIVEEHGNKTEAVVNPYKHFPLRDSELVKYADIKWEMVAPKFGEINATLPPEGEGVERLSESDLQSIDKFVATLKDRASYHSSSVTLPQLSLVAQMVSHSYAGGKFVVPATNLARMGVMHPMAAEMWAKEAANGGAADLITPLLTLATSSSSKSTLVLLALRVLSNCFSRRVLARALIKRHEAVLEGVMEVMRKYGGEENIVLAGVAVFINYAILLHEGGSAYDQEKVLLLTSVVECLQQAAASSPKVAYRCMVILGTLAYGDANTTELARDLDVAEAVASAASAAACKEDAHVQQVAKEMQALLTAK